MALLVTVEYEFRFCMLFLRENVRAQVGLKVQAGNMVAYTPVKTVYDMLEMAAVVIVSAGDEQSGLMINEKVLRVGVVTDAGSSGLVTLTCKANVPSSSLSVDRIR